MGSSNKLAHACLFIAYAVCQFLAHETTFFTLQVHAQTGRVSGLIYFSQLSKHEGKHANYCKAQ